MNGLLKTVTRQHCDCDLNPGPSICARVQQTSMLTTQLPSHPLPAIGIAKEHGVCRPKLIVRPASLQHGHQSNNGVSVNCDGE